MPKKIATETERLREAEALLGRALHHINRLNEGLVVFGVDPVAYAIERFLAPIPRLPEENGACVSGNHAICPDADRCICECHKPA